MSGLNLKYNVALYVNVLFKISKNKIFTVLLSN